MTTSPRRPMFGRTALIAMLVGLLVALAACGGAPASTGGAPASGGGISGNASASAGPEDRVKSFFQDFSGALSDPDLAKETKQEEWATKLSGYALPDQQAKAKSDMKQALQSMGSMPSQLNALTGGQNADVHLKMEFTDVQTKLDSQSGDTAKVKLVGGKFKISLTGKDVDKLGDAAKGVNQELPIEQFMSQTAKTDGGLLNLKQVGGVWYLTDISK